MFEGGVPAHEQLHQFIAAAASLTPPFDHPFNNNNIIHPTTSSNSHQLLLQPHHHQLNQVVSNPGVVQLHRQSTAATENLDQGKEENRSISTRSVVVAVNDGDHQADWGNDELLALLRIRSTMENWFPEFTWEHVSRKLAELGFKRSADKCKEKFEEESTYFNFPTKNFRFLSDDLQHLYQQHHHPPPQKGEEDDKLTEKLAEKLPISDQQGVDHRDKMCPTSDEVVLEDSTTRNTEKAQEEIKKKSQKNVDTKKRKRRQRRFEMLKGYCEGIVNRMMTQQEEMHKKLLEDMARRNEEKLAREEAWKIKETERMNNELETMAKEQAAAGNRQTQIIKFLKKFASTSENPNGDDCHQPQNPSEPKEADHPTSSTTVQNNPTTPSEALAPQTPSSTTLIPYENPKNPNYSDLGKRWPRDEVLALINLRSSLFSNNSSGSSENNGQDKDGAVIKAPLWERISQGMLGMGYKRSAKRCKEKWENINKYFRKTKDGNKKRPLDSRTCPYFHQLSNLYNQGVLSDQPPEDAAPPTTEPEKRASNGMVVPQVGGS